MKPAYWRWKIQSQSELTQDITLYPRARYYESPNNLPGKILIVSESLRFLRLSLEMKNVRLCREKLCAMFRGAGEIQFKNFFSYENSSRAF